MMFGMGQCPQPVDPNYPQGCPSGSTLQPMSTGSVMSFDASGKPTAMMTDQCPQRYQCTPSMTASVPLCTTPECLADAAALSSQLGTPVVAPVTLSPWVLIIGIVALMYLTRGR